ncbi:hypothetical protein FOMG_17024 [Fusarium oxysporum f. sp. melonis 26406]|uniref:Uncharacterized protein n=1 Tax=Fusarium oxysporum f. sp. melonis 26406 TaxID=1089452 RepID=W9ZZB9_FUSOX|nr:hypothetical protein FOMG_17024 [Fusarium oxysporum f. sp. melonis 26406]
MPSPYVSLPAERRRKKSRTVESYDENDGFMIPGIELDKVMIYGPEILRILRRYCSSYREVMDPKCSGSNDQEIVDLLSLDAEMGEDAYEDKDREDSPYFNTNRHADIPA